MIKDFLSNGSVLGTYEPYIDEDYVDQLSLAKNDSKYIDFKNTYSYTVSDCRSKNIINKQEKSSETIFIKENIMNNIINNNNKKEEKNNYDNSFQNRISEINKSNNTEGRKNFLCLSEDFKCPINQNIHDKIINRNEMDMTFSVNSDFNNTSTSFFSKNNMFNIDYLNPLKSKLEDKTLDGLTQIQKNDISRDSYESSGIFMKIFKQKRKYKKKVNEIILDLDDNCFPFKSGKGIINMTSLGKTEESTTEKWDNSNIFFSGKDEMSIPNAPSPQENDLYLMKFKTKKYFINENGKKRRIIIKRKLRPDIIIKKIKSRFHKSLKNIINIYLKKAGSKELFDYLPQCFLTNVTKNLNLKYFELTYNDLVYNDFTAELNKGDDYKNLTIDRNKCIKNRKVLSYLDNNPTISNDSGFEKLRKMKYKDILSNYFVSKEFEDSLNIIRKENEGKDYLQSYIYQAKNYIKFFTCNDSKNMASIEDDNEEDAEDDDELDDNSDNNC